MKSPTLPKCSTASSGSVGAPKVGVGRNGDGAKGDEGMRDGVCVEREVEGDWAMQ